MSDTYFGPGTVDNVKCYLRASESEVHFLWSFTWVWLWYSFIDGASSIIVSLLGLHLPEVAVITYALLPIPTNMLQEIIFTRFDPNRKMWMPFLSMRFSLESNRETWRHVSLSLSLFLRSWPCFLFVLKIYSNLAFDFVTQNNILPYCLCWHFA